ncbi:MULTISPECIES: MlaD family protein [Nitrosomonas]|uniref:Phospholipid/cholesterol/gamma-HCH transport system substrate-binding protein n=2 Tax=Nitrosomonas eutropha TaxID=916 RepID=A0ABX5M602_9PROT|nr:MULTISPECIES: MlaD family protein [Nitrosomonas]ABI58684.1 Mammalian cell entry related domain protein [Nitrosomonas eutropha C91]MXS79579.1 MCE family protein [Nitrosomonas sp. GH22]PXV80153.1 phospholipid/cholesterol/gamma-HCH transport system substrate-binding protein [Nitrosomonas eutropha]SCX20869.1 phospholipid/cholesterol/gamma-HCH transport system substrate-binding protein [Nitrosomonas eutropha]SDW20552.1 phospholipid/cholesterol/gamma-HCH transport system substrate-binding protein
MENRAHAFAAGLFVLLLGVAAVMAVKWLSRDNINHNHYFLISAGGSVSGLNPEASVRYRGVNIGKVEEIYFDKENIRNIIVRIAVSSHVTLPKNIYAQLASQGITGLTYVELNDDVSEAGAGYLENEAHIFLRSSLIKTLSDSLEEILKNSNTVIKQINNLLNKKNQAHIGKILSHLEQTVQHYDKLTEELQNGLQALPQLTGEFTSTFRQTRQVMENTSQVLQKLNQQQGLIDNLTQGSLEMAHTLDSLNETGQAVTQSTRKLNQLLNLLEAHPQSLVFGKPPALPGPGEPGFTPPQPIK